VAQTMTRNEVLAAEAVIPDEVPVAVVSSGRDEEWERGQREVGAKSKRRRWDLLEGVGHEVWRDERGRETLKRRLGELVRSAGKGSGVV
jgi:hypothetical protein